MRFHQATLWSIVYVMCKNNSFVLMLKQILCFFADRSIFPHSKCRFRKNNIQIPQKAAILTLIAF